MTVLSSRLLQTLCFFFFTLLLLIAYCRHETATTFSRFLKVMLSSAAVGIETAKDQYARTPSPYSDLVYPTNSVRR